MSFCVLLSLFYVHLKNPLASDIEHLLATMVYVLVLLDSKATNQDRCYGYL